MSIDHPDELEGLRRAGAVVAEALRELLRAGELVKLNVCAELNGHGIGRRIHEPAEVPSVYDAGMRDGWTVRTVDGSPVADAEHTIVVTDGAPLVLTA